MHDKFLSVVFNKEFDVTNKKENLEVFLKINVSVLRGGLLKSVNGSDLTVLMAIASYMNINGQGFPTQRQIADITGMSLTTVNKSIKNLLAIKINGYPVLERKLIGSGSKKSSKYTIFDVMPIMDDEEVEPDISNDPVNFTVEIDKPMNCKDYAIYFSKRYEEAYGMPYVINFKRDLALIKNKLESAFEQDEIVNMIDIVIEQYKERWASPKYPYPTIAMLCTWLGNKAVEEMLKAKETDAEVDELIEMAHNTTNNNMDLFK